MYNHAVSYMYQTMALNNITIDTKKNHDNKDHQYADQYSKPYKNCTYHRVGVKSGNYKESPMSSYQNNTKKSFSNNENKEKEYQEYQKQKYTLLGRPIKHSVGKNTLYR